jgi:hypothetical protein
MTYHNTTVLLREVFLYTAKLPLPNLLPTSLLLG